MPYIGNDLATQFQAFATQTITGDGSTGYTLDRAVANGKELLVYINNVKQEEGSGKSYTATGTTITFSAAVASGDSCYLVYMGSAQQTVNPPDASVGSSQISSADLVLPKTVTIGSAGAEDTKLVFDGNAQDYHVGLDDSADSLTIGLGSTLGTTSHMVIDASGAVTKPLQPAFLAEPSSTQSDLAINTSNLQINFGSEVFDQNGDYDTSNSTFTAPVTVKYQLNLNVYFVDINADYSYLYLQIRTSNRNYRSQIGPTVFDSSGDFSMQISHICDMDASDTATITCQLPNTGSNQTDVNTYSQFSGYLVA